MEITDKKRFAELMSGLAQTFTIDISPRDLENYWRLLKGYPLIQVEQAIIGYCISPEGHKFMPKPGEIISAIYGKQNDQSLLAWVKVMKAMRQIGGSKTVVFDDAVIHAVIADLGGWIRLCRMTERELGFYQKEFERLYTCYLSRPLKTYPKQLSGITDTVNTASGYAQQQPVLIGDPVKAAFVFQQGDKNNALSTKILSVSQVIQLSEEKQTSKSKNPSNQK